MKLAILVLVASATAAKADAISNATTGLFVAAELSLAVDFAQTLDAGRHRPGLYETNPLLGRYPSTPLVLGYFGGIMLGEAALYHWGPRWLSNSVSGTTIFLQIPVIIKSFSLGLGFPF